MMIDRYLERNTNDLNFPGAGINSKIPVPWIRVIPRRVP